MCAALQIMCMCLRSYAVTCPGENDHGTRACMSTSHTTRSVRYGSDEASVPAVSKSMIEGREAIHTVKADA